MIKLKYLTILLLSISFSSTIAQPTFSYTDKEKEFKQASDYFNAGQYALAYPILKNLMSIYKSANQTDHSYLNDDLCFFYYTTELKLMIQAGEEHLKKFITETDNLARKQQACFHLAHYYYLLNEFDQAIDFFSQCTYDNLSNDQIADLKFEKGYSLFNNKKFDEAKSLFDEVHQVSSSKYYLASNYYFGFISYYEKNYVDALECFTLVQTKPEYNGVVPYYIAEILYFRNQKDEAMQYGDSVLSKGGGAFYKRNLQLLLGQLYFEKQDYLNALVYLEDYANSNEKMSKEVLYELSYCYYKNNSTAKAIEGFKQLSNEKDSMGQNSMYLLGGLYISINDKSNARSAFQYCAYNNSNLTQQRISRFNYAKLSYELGYQNIALAEIGKYLTDYPNSDVDAEAKEILFSLLANTNNFTEGISLYKSMSNPSPKMQKIYAKLLYGKAVQFINDQQPEEANALLKEILITPQSDAVVSYARFWLGEIAYRQQRYDDAIQYYTSFINSKVGSQGEANYSNAKYGLGYSYLQKGDYQNAMINFESIGTSVSPTSTSMQQDAFVRSADCNYMLRNFDKAAAKYEIIISNAMPQADYALFQKAMIAGVKNSSEKIRLLNAISKLYSSSSFLLESQMEIALTYIDDEKFSEAIPYLNKVLASPDAAGMKPKAYSKLGLSYYNSNDNKNALTAYKNLIKQYPQSSESEEALYIIKDIYVEEGDPDEYLNLMQSNGITVAVNEADSLSFSAGLKKYDAGDCVAASKSFSSYLTKYLNGAFAIDANYYQGLCYRESKDFANAVKCFDFVNSKGVSRYFDNATLELARVYYFEMKDYVNSKKYFESLYNSTTNPEKQLDALRGLVRSNYQLKDYSSANESSLELLNKKGISNDDKTIGLLVLGKSQQASGDTVSAMSSFKSVAAMNKSAWGAEARYEIANCYFSLNNLAAAEKSAMAVIKETGSYDYWVTKSYILLGDIFIKQKDYFNAKATFESVAKNASIAELKIEAEEKLSRTISLEKKSSRISN